MQTLLLSDSVSQIKACPWGFHKHSLLYSNMPPFDKPRLDLFAKNNDDMSGEKQYLKK